MKLEIGLDAIGSYKRLAYTPWHALAEFVDNSTQSYFDHQDELDPVLQADGEGLTVSIVYEKDQGTGFLRITDNALGMSYDDLQRALHVAHPPSNTSGRSKYGMGLKTGATWIGNHWTVRTKKLGETTEHFVEIDVDAIASGKNELPYVRVEGKSDAAHYTIIEITRHNRRFQGRTLGKIKDFLRSMYREDFRKNVLKLEWQGDPLTWHDIDERLLIAPDGTPYKKDFEFNVDDTKRVHGWVGILERGSRADAGFSIIHSGRVVRGWPDSWRPSKLYGQMQGSNDLVNQRLVGEIHLDAFEVSHTKDDILWLGDQEEAVEQGLFTHCGDYREYASLHRKRGDDERGPSPAETSTGIDEFKKELQSPEIIDQIEIGPIPPQEAVDSAIDNLVASITDKRSETVRASIGSLTVKLFVLGDLSPNDPYVAIEAAKPAEVIVIVNTAHPHWSQLKGSEGVLNYLRHCTYDGIAEWQARQKAATIDPDTIKLLKDKLLRLSLQIEGHAEAQPKEAAVPES